MGILFGLFAAPANVDAGTITIDAVNDAFEVDFTGTSSSNGYPVSIESDWLTTAFTSTSITFQVSVTNTTPPRQIHPRQAPS